jgi:hypothetical protein
VLLSSGFAAVSALGGGVTAVSALGGGTILSGRGSGDASESSGKTRFRSARQISISISSALASGSRRASAHCSGHRVPKPRSLPRFLAIRKTECMSRPFLRSGGRHRRQTGCPAPGSYPSAPRAK